MPIFNSKQRAGQGAAEATHPRGRSLHYLYLRSRSSPHIVGSAACFSCCFSSAIGSWGSSVFGADCELGGGLPALATSPKPSEQVRS